MDDAALERLGQFHFPGNVRQLENICHWLTVMAPTQVIEVKDLPPEVLEIRGSVQTVQLPPVAVPKGLGSAPSAAHADLQANATATARHDALGALEALVLGDPGGAGHPGGPGFAASPVSLAASGQGWEPGLEQEALTLLKEGRTDVWDALTRRFETSLIQAALATTRGRRIEAAQKLGIGRNTITRKIQELGLDEA